MVRASRHRRDGAIELTEPDWPSDSRFDLSNIDADDAEDIWEGLSFFERDGFDTSIVRALHADRTLISWHRAYVNNRTGSPYVGHSIVARVDADTARIVHCGVRPMSLPPSRSSCV